MTDHVLSISSFSLITDGVMGGVSRGTLARESVQGRDAIRMRGTVSLENNGGFIQMAADVPSGDGFTGIELTAQGNGETYNVHLRTSDITRPWQSYRQSFIAGPAWETHHIPFSDFTPHRLETPLDVTRLTRLGVLGIGRVFEVDISVAALQFY